MLVSRTPRLAAACLVAAVVAGAAFASSRPETPGSGAAGAQRGEAPAGKEAGAGAPCASPPCGAATPLDDAGYFAVADRLSARLDALWNPRADRYDPGPGGATSQINADLLLVHATAARAGHRGPARQDARARAAARYLTSREIWRQGRARPGWVASADVHDMHPVFQGEVAEGLAAAYRARGALGLEPATAGRIRAQLARMVSGRAWRWPALLLNQFNWNATLYAADAAVNGSDRALAVNLRRHLARFVARAAGPDGALGNFGPGLRFRYDPRWTRSAINFDSPEYANIVLGFARVYGQARAAGMPRPAGIGLLRDWVRRVLSGAWTHAGYLNWDTGLGFSRWHQRKKVALAHGALIGIAAEPELQPAPRWGRWAKWMLDRGLRDYVALTERGGRVPASLAYGVNAMPEARRMAYLTAARHAANAMRAYDAGLGRRAASEPPALYSFDADTGRLAITTRTYNTAIVPANGGAQPYGGLDLARLFDARQEVAANIGGTDRAAFGLQVRAGGKVLRTQYGGRGGESPLELAGSRRPGLRADAGPFTELRARGSVTAGGLRATSAYRFTPDAIEGRWSVTGRGGRATVTFPSWGARARVVATLGDGRRVAIGRRPLSLRDIRRFHVQSARSGYTLLVRGTGRARVVTTRPQASQPNPGPTLELDLGATPARVAVTIAVDRPRG